MRQYFSDSKVRVSLLDFLVWGAFLVSLPISRLVVAPVPISGIPGDTDFVVLRLPNVRPMGLEARNLQFLLKFYCWGEERIGALFF